MELLEINRRALVLTLMEHASRLQVRGGERAARLSRACWIEIQAIEAKPGQPVGPSPALAEAKVFLDAEQGAASGVVSRG